MACVGISPLQCVGEQGYSMAALKTKQTKCVMVWSFWISPGSWITGTREVMIKSECAAVPEHTPALAQVRSFAREIFFRCRSLFRVHPTRSAPWSFITAVLPTKHLFDPGGPC